MHGGEGQRVVPPDAGPGSAAPVQRERQRPRWQLRRLSGFRRKTRSHDLTRKCDGATNLTAAPLKRIRSLTSIDVLRVLYIYTNLCGIEESALQVCVVHNNLFCVSLSPLKAFFSLFLYLPP